MQFDIFFIFHLPHPMSVYQNVKSISSSCYKDCDYLPRITRHKLFPKPFPNFFNKQILQKASLLCNMPCCELMWLLLQEQFVQILVSQFYSSTYLTCQTLSSFLMVGNESCIFVSHVFHVMCGTLRQK